MRQYMIEIRLPEILNEEFLSLIPAQRLLISRLMHQGVIINYALAIESSKLWITMITESEEMVITYLAEMPIIGYVDTEIFELTFQNSNSFVLNSFSVN
jgi:hypothetical protein